MIRMYFHIRLYQLPNLKSMEEIHITSLVSSNILLVIYLVLKISNRIKTNLTVTVKYFKDNL
jgi:hypothetical protein